MEKEIIIEILPGFQASGNIGRVAVSQGEFIKKGQLLFTIEGKKGASDFKSEFTGQLKSLFIEDGQEIKKGQTIGIIEAEEELVEEELSSDVAEEDINERISADLVILGGGPGGYVAAIRGAQRGRKVILVEEDELGGTCLNRGCIPTKSMVQSTRVKDLMDKADIFGLDKLDASLSMEKLMDRKDNVVASLVAGINSSMDKHGIRVIRGRGRGYDEKSIVVNQDGREILLSFDKLILATGSTVSIPGFEGAGDKDILSSDDLLELREIPDSLIILGGRVIAMEFAFIYSKLGTKVTVVQRSKSIFPNLDEDIVEVIRKSAKENGINLVEGASTKAIKSTVNGGKLVIIDQDASEKMVAADRLAIATGRKPNLEGLNLDRLKVKLSETTKGIEVDPYMLTSNENIYAIGDATNIYNLAHVASKQGLVAIDNICGLDKKMDYSAIPEAVFTDPEIGLVGRSEKDCKKENIDYIIGKFPYMANGKALVEDSTEGFIKLIAKKDTREIIGGALVGLAATDLLSTVTNLVANKNTIEEAKDVVYAHPTVSEAVFESILDLDMEALHK